MPPELWVVENGVTRQLSAVALTEGATVATPASGVAAIGVRSDGTVYRKRSTGGEWPLTPVFKTKAADTSRTSNATLADDPDLFFAIGANEKWVFHGALYYTAAPTTGRIQVAFTVPSGGTIRWGGPGVVNSATAPGAAGAWQARNSATSINFGGVTSLVIATFHGYAAAAATAGNVVLQWAQNESSTTATVVELGSHLVAHRVA